MDTLENNTNVTQDFYAQTGISRPLFFLWFGFFVTVCVVATVVILLLLLVMITEKKWRSGSSILIIHLLILDLIACSILFPLSIFSSFLALFEITIFLACPAFGILTFGGWLVGCWAGTAVALNRFIAIVCPNAYKHFSSKSVLVLFIVASWVCGLSCAIPGLFGAGNHYAKGSRILCELRAHYDATWYTLIFLGLFLPNILQGILYGAIGIATTGRNSSTVTPSGVQGKRQSRNKRVLQMLMASYATSLVCHVVVPVMLGLLDPEVENMYALTFVGLLLEMVGFASGPIIYLIVNDEYRRGVKRLMLNCGKRDPTSSVTEPTMDSVRHRTATA